MNYFRIFIPVFLAVSGCASVAPESDMNAAAVPLAASDPQVNAYAGAADIGMPPFYQVRDNIDAYIGRTVSWDGTVVRATNSEVEIQVRQADNSAPTAPYSAAQRRFLAHSSSALNLQQIRPGQPITVTGTVTGNTILNFNGEPAMLPTVAIAGQPLAGRNNTGTGPVAYGQSPPRYSYQYPDYYYQPRPRYYRYYDYYRYPWYYPLRLGISLGYRNYHSSGFSYGIGLGL